MIRINRGACPACLTRKVAKEAYRKRQVVDALWRMQHGKCCYSETKIPGDGHGKAVEHFRPQSKFKWKRNEWKNLLLVCPQCNGKKSDVFPEELADAEDVPKVISTQSSGGAGGTLIDPSDQSVDPEEHITYVLDDRDPLFGQIIPRDGSALGRTTIEITGIDHDHFFRARQRRALEVLLVEYQILLLAVSDENPDARNARLARFSQLMSANSEFAGLAREFARDRKLDDRFGLAIPGPTA